MHPLYSRNAAASMVWAALLLAPLLTAPAFCSEPIPPRARDLGIPFAGTAGPLNAITDVAAVEVGHATLTRGEGPLVAETWDGFLNDIYGQHVHEEDVFHALDSATGGPVPEGNVGGGTGMRTFEFSGGIGTASRSVDTPFGRFTLGVLVQSNFGMRAELRMAGVPLGAEITDLLPQTGAVEKPGGNSIVAIIATDTPLIPTQLRRLARRATLALGRVGSNGHGGSGDIFLAFSTANRMTAYWGKEINHLSMLPDMDPLFEATVQATEEAIINALVAGKTMTGVDGNTVHALPHERVRQILRKYNRLESAP